MEMSTILGGERIGDAVIESEGEEDAEQSSAEPTLQQQLKRAPVTAAKSRVPGAPEQAGRPQLSKPVKRNYNTFLFLGRGRSPPWPKAAQRHRRH